MRGINKLPQQLLRVALDSFPASAVILNKSGIILYVNEAWRSFADEHGLAEQDYGVGKSYLDLCQLILGGESAESEALMWKLQQVMKNEQPEVWLEFPFFSRTKWYRACATRLEPPDFNQSFKVLVVHQDITRQKQAERKLQELSDRLSDSQKRERFSRVNNPITILIADDHTMILEAFKHMLEPEFEVVGTVTDGRALLTAAATLKPNVILLDISMPLLNGLDAGRRIKKLMPAVKLIYLTMDQDPNVAAEAFRVGASGYLLKNSAASELLHAIREGVKGRFYLTTLMTQGMAGSSFNNYHRSHKRSERLTARQREVVQLLAEGRSMKEVASLLNITTRTVAYHKYTVMEQHQIKTSAGLIQFAIKNHLLSV